MLAKRILPCLDVDRGRVVKGTNFVNLRDAGDPVEVAARYEAEGADELVFLDITASHEGRGIILDVVGRTAEVCFMPLTVGGGIRNLDDIRALGFTTRCLNESMRLYPQPPVLIRRALEDDVVGGYRVGPLLLQCPLRQWRSARPGHSGCNHPCSRSR